MPTATAAILASKPRLAWLDDDALNGEPEAAALDAPLTPGEAFFVRNNGTMPDTRLLRTGGWRSRERCCGRSVCPWPTSSATFRL